MNKQLFLSFLGSLGAIAVVGGVSFVIFNKKKNEFKKKSTFEKISTFL